MSAAGDVERDVLAVELGDVLAPRQHERRLVGTLERERRDARKDLAGGDRDVVDGADLVAAGVDNRLAQHLGQVDHGALPPCRALGAIQMREAACRPGGSSGGCSPREPAENREGRRGSTDCEVSRRPLSSGYRSRQRKSPCVRVDEGQRFARMSSARARRAHLAKAHTPGVFTAHIPRLWIWHCPT